jgi:hypothetical protein
MDVVCLQPSCKVCVATEVVIVIADHHSDLDTSPGRSELIENGLVRRNDVIDLFDALYESQFPEPERITDDQQFSIRTCAL